MKNVFIILCLFIFAANAFAQTPVEDPKKRFLSAPKHYKKVAKDTKKLEKSLTTPRIKPAKEPVVEEAPLPEPELTPPPAEEAAPAQEAAASTEAQEPAAEEPKVVEGPKEDLTNWILSVGVAAELQMIHAKDQFSRTVRLVSNVGVSGRASLGYMFSDHVGIIGDYAIDKVQYNNFDTYVVAQDHGYRMAGRLGARLRFADSFSLDVLGGIQQHYTVYLPTFTTLTVERFNHGSITLGFNYTFYTGEKFVMAGRTELEAYIPTSKTATGLGALTELRFGVPVGAESSFYFNIGTSYMDFKQTIAKQYNVAGFLGSGFILAN